MVPFDRALVSFYRPSVVTFPLSLHVSEILPLMFSKTPFFPTPPLFPPKFPHVPPGLGGSPFGYKERRCRANCPCNQFQRFPTYVIINHQRHRRTDRRTDGQTDGQTTCDRKTALCTMHSASHGKNSWKMISGLISLTSFLFVGPNMTDLLQMEHFIREQGKFQPEQEWGRENCRFSTFKPPYL